MIQSFIILLFFITGISANQAYAQENELRFKYITTEEGLSNDIVNCITQDQDGFMWIGTMEGLNCYNGYENTVFKKVLNDSTSLADNMVFDIYIDHSNHIWVGTQNGLCLYNPDKENFTTYLLDTVNYQLNTANRVVGTKEDSHNKMYVVTEHGFLYYYNKEKTEFEKDTHNFHSIRDFIIDKNDVFWIGGDNGLYYYDKRDGKFIHFSSYIHNGKEYAISHVNTIYEEGDTIWVGTIHGRILYVLKESMELQIHDYDFDKSYYVYDINKSRNGLMYISTTDGLFIYDKSTNVYTAYKYDKNNFVGINTYGATLTYEDRQGNLWVGTYQGGVNLAVAGKAFCNYNMYSKEITLDVANVSSVYEDSKGMLWIGSFNFGMNLINPDTGKKHFFLHDDNDPGSLGPGSVLNIFEDSNKNIWIGTYLEFLQRYDSVRKKFIRYDFFHDKDGNKIGRDIRSMAEDNEGNLWMVCHSKAIIKFNPATNQYKLYEHDESHLKTSLADNWAFQLIIDYKGYVWVATPSGLSKLDPQTETITNYSHIEDDSATLCNNFITTLFEDSNKNLWIGTKFGLDLFNRKAETFTHFYEENGLPSNEIKAVLEYKPGELWLSTGYGLSRMRYEVSAASGNMKAVFRNYNVSDNLQDVFFWDRSACKTKGGKLIFGGENGIVVFDPEEIKENKKKPEVFITGFKLFNNPVKAGDKNSLLTQNIRRTKVIKLKYNQNYISFGFVAINYISVENNRYKYMLENFDDTWIKAGENREAIYTNLPPGEYIFRVIASNNDGYWNTKGASVQVIISPPFWATWGFRILVIIAILSIAVSYYLFKINILKSRNIVLEENMQVRMWELSELNRELMEKHNRIKSQNDEITSRNKEIQHKNEEISEQKELLEREKYKVERAFEHLKKYRHKLEELVEERTHELIEAKEKAEESDRLKSSFLANLSHEIRTPLNSIIGFSNLIFDPSVSKEERLSYKSIIDGSSRTLLNLINDIIDFSKIEAMHLDLIFGEVYLKSIFEDLKDIFELEINNQLEKNKNIEFRLKLENEIEELNVVTDETRLRQILTNLINNAIKFTHEGYIEVGCQRLADKKKLEFYVKDTGIGIKKEDQQLIFQRFRKLEHNIEYLYQGAGLGLSITKHLVHLLGGDIRVESEADKGSVFYFTLPVKHSEKKHKEVEMKKEFLGIPDLHDKVILVAEDDQANFSYLEKLLQKTGGRILRAHNGNEIITLYKENPEAVMILMDIKMPGKNGIDAFTELKKLNIGIPVIAQTAYAFSEEIGKIKDAGFADYITKPINADDLYRAMFKYLK